MPMAGASGRCRLTSCAAIGGGASLPGRRCALTGAASRRPTGACPCTRSIRFAFSQSKRPADEFAGQDRHHRPDRFVAVQLQTDAGAAKVHPGVGSAGDRHDNFQRGGLPARAASAGSQVVITVSRSGCLPWRWSHNVDVRRQNLFFTSAGVVHYRPTCCSISAIRSPRHDGADRLSLIYFTLVKLLGVIVTFRRNGHPLFSTLLDDGRTCRAVVMQVRVYAQGRNARVALFCRLKKAVGQSRRGVVTPPLFGLLPMYRLSSATACCSTGCFGGGVKRDAVVDVAQTLAVSSASSTSGVRSGMATNRGRFGDQSWDSFTIVDEDDRWRQTARRVSPGS